MVQLKIYFNFVCVLFHFEFFFTNFLFFWIKFTIFKSLYIGLVSNLKQIYLLNLKVSTPFSDTIKGYSIVKKGVSNMISCWIFLTIMKDVWKHVSSSHICAFDNLYLFLGICSFYFLCCFLIVLDKNESFLIQLRSTQNL